MHRIRLLQARRYRTNGKTEKSAGSQCRKTGQARLDNNIIIRCLSILWISPIFMVLLNSFKRKAYIFKHPFGISTVSITEGFEAFKDGMSRLFCSTLNYKNGLRMTHFWDCFGNSLFITVGSVVLIVLCCSMCAWYIVRVKTKGTKLMYTLCLFSMIVPFQMVMFTLSKFANMLHLSNPLGIIMYTLALEQDLLCLCLQDL